MNQEFKITLDIAQLVMLGGLIWGLAKMSASVNQLREVTGKLTRGLETIEGTLSDLAGRVLVVEDRTGRRATDRL